MIVKVQYTKLKPNIGDAVGVARNGCVRKVKWKKLIIGHRVKHNGKCAKNEIWIDTTFNLPIIGIAGEPLKLGCLVEQHADSKLYCASNPNAPIGFITKT